MGTMFICVCILACFQISSVLSDSVIVSSLRGGQTNLTIMDVNVTGGSLSIIQSESFLKPQILTDIAIDPISGTLFGFDFRYGNILQYPGFGRSGASVTGSVVHKGLTRNTLVKIAVDWVSQNIYWVDPGFRWIGIQSVSNQTKHTIILHDGFTYPVSLAVDPIHRVLFWGDGSSSPKIERSSLDGGNRRTIVSQGIIFPTAMTVDVDNEQLIWLDLTRDTVEMAAQDGTARRILRRLSHIYLSHVDVFKDTQPTIISLGVDWRDGNLYWSEGQTDGRIIVHSRQERATVPLIDSGLSMPRELTLKMFWISGDVGIVQIERANMDGTNREIIVNSSSVRAPLGLAIDTLTDIIMFWTDHGFADGTSSEVLAANMDGSQRRVINSNMGWANGLTIDTTGKFLYIADGKTDTISKCNYNGICSAFFSDAGAQLMDIKLLENSLYYTAWNRV
ncbi:LRP6-like protein [Mya arenaria]|uniref:LRP6-like protein n=1 Tax=Mya arenaria TaxID=6604 RepID=A0ABY7DJQ6_MYAAR|nr:LRP6-like protein [Mya arenaria]